MNENENEREYEGVKLIAKSYDNCHGCFYLSEDRCHLSENAPDHVSLCSPLFRKDKKSIIWIEKGAINQPTPTIQQSEDPQSSRQERIAKAFNITTGKNLSADDIELIEFLAKKIN